MWLRKYFPIYKISFLAMMTYRWECFFAILSSLLMIGFMYYLWQAIFIGMNSNVGAFQATFVYVSMGIGILISFNSCIDAQVSSSISSGDIIRDLIRPLNYHFKLFAAALGSIGFRVFLVFIPSFILVYWLTPPGLFTVESILFFVVSLPGAILILLHLDILTGLISVRTEASWGIRLAKDYLIMLFSGALIPFHFLPTQLKEVFLMLPFQGICHTPLNLLSHSELSDAERIKLLIVQYVWAFALIVLVNRMIKRMEKNIEIYGG